MNFSKVKMIIILCLLVVNIIFAFLCIRLISKTNYISEEEAELASANLLKNGISVEFDKDARKLYSLPVYVSQMTQTDGYIPVTYMRITESFFGVKTDGAAYVKTPDGYSISVKNSDGVLMGSSSVYGNTGFECFASDAVEYKNSSELYAVPYTEELDDDRESEYGIAAGFVVSAFKDYGIKFVYSGSRSFEDGKIVSFCGELSDTKVIDAYINVFVKDGKIACCAGNLFDDVPERKYSTVIVDSIDAVYLLYDYIRHERENAVIGDAQIDDISMVYDSVEYSYGEYYIIPTWIIRYKENGASVIYSVDAVNGNRIRELS